MNIAAKKKGNEEFYYLKYSYRKNGKIINKEKYLGKEIPSDKELEKLKKEICVNCTKFLSNDNYNLLDVLY
jgi:hypothetical protein